MAIRKSDSEVGQEFWKSVQESLREMENWPEWKRNIRISASGSGYTDGSSKSKGGAWTEKREEQ